MTNVAPMAMSMPQGMMIQPGAGYPVALPQVAMQQGFMPQSPAPQGFMPQGPAPQGFMPQGAVPRGVTTVQNIPMTNQSMPMMGVPGTQQGMPQMVSPQMGMGMPAAGAQGILGAEAMKPPSTLKTVLKSALVTGGIGAALGAGATLLPFVPGGFLMGGLIGGIAGVAVGAFRGIKKANQEKEQFQAMMSTPAQTPGDAGALGPEVPLTPVKHKSKKQRPTNGGRNVTVKAGDTLGAIAKAHKVTVKALHAENRKEIGADPNKLKIGVKLVVPAKVE